MALLLKNKLPPNMRSTFWNDFLDVIEEESHNMKDAIIEKQYNYVIDKMDNARMIELSTIFGIPFDVSVDSSDEFLREEIRSTPFRIKWKATIKLYKSFFQAINRTGIIYLYYYNGSDLVRHSKDLLLSINGADPTLPYTQQSQANFSGYLTEQLKLDTGLKLDEATPWKLDNASSKLNTKHLAFEFILDQVFFGSDVGLAPSLDLAPSLSLAPQTKIRYLMDSKYFSYIQTNLEVSKKVTEVAHVGCQLTAISDNSRFYNSLQNFFTMPTIYLNTVTTDNITGISSVSDMHFMEFGISSIGNLPSYLGAGTQPTALAEKIAKIQIVQDEKYEDSSWYGVSACYTGNLINDKVIGTGDGITSTFTSTLPYAPIKRGNVKIFFTSGAISYYTEDDEHGNFNGGVADGTINYETGEITINTEIYKNESSIIGTGTGSELHFTYKEPSVPIKDGSLIIKYVIGGQILVATDSTSGVISGTLCTGTVNYITGDISLTFSTAPVLDTNISMEFQYQKISIPDVDTELITEYYFVSEEINITEASVTDINGNLLAYATFPRIQFNSFFNHLSMNFIMKKSNF